jgi:hypothetical protein
VRGGEGPRGGKGDRGREITQRYKRGGSINRIERSVQSDRSPAPKKNNTEKAEDTEEKPCVHATPRLLLVIDSHSTCMCDELGSSPRASSLARRRLSSSRKEKRGEGSEGGLDYWLTLPTYYPLTYLPTCLTRTCLLIYLPT